jgi:hypothetical protein
MEQYKNEKGLQCSLVSFKSRYGFFVINFLQITSIKMENFHASQGKKTGQEQNFIWGSYDLLIDYVKYHKKEEVPQMKIFSRGFSYIISSSADFGCEDSGEIKRNLICEAEYNYRITPVPFFLFPLLSKIKFIPFKVTVTVQGKINAVSSENVPKKEHELEKNNTCEENKTEEVPVIIAAETTERESLIEGITEEVPLIKEEHPEETVVVKKEKIQKQKDLIAQEKKKVHTNVPVPNPQYYKTYRLFYEQFYQNQQVKGNAKKKSR